MRLIVARCLACLAAASVAALTLLAGPAQALADTAPFLPVTGSPFAAGNETSSVAFNHAGNLLAAANMESNNVSVFFVSPATGRLTKVIGSPFHAGSGPSSATFSPNGRLLVTTNVYSNNLSVFSVSPTAGRLIPITGGSSLNVNGPLSAAFSPNGRLLATASRISNNMSVFSVSPSGRLAKITGSPFATGRQPDQVAFSPNGKLLATANYGGKDVSVFSVNATSGRVRQITGSPFATGKAPDFNPPNALAFSSNGRLLATASEIGDNVSVFSVSAATGALTPVTGSPFHVSNGLPVGTGSPSKPGSLAFSPKGGSLATANGSNNVSIFSDNPRTGALTQATGSPFATGNSPEAIAFSPNGALLVTANGANNLSVFSQSSVLSGPA
jgi:6-phosphogluconolactonase (cycloisomerase 2 family)